MLCSIPCDLHALWLNIPSAGRSKPFAWRENSESWLRAIQAFDAQLVPSEYHIFDNSFKYLLTKGYFNDIIVLVNMELGCCK